MNSALNVTEAPYHADPSGRRDSTDAIVRALNDITHRTRVAFAQTLKEMAKLPAEGEHPHPGSFENRRVDGDVFGVTCAHLPYVPVLYFPEGTYLVSDTLCYRHRDLVNTAGAELNQQIRLRGAGVDKTVIRLADHTGGFGAGARKPVISFMPADTSNVATSNYCEDLTIDCGRGNPGTVGLDFFANNSGAVRNVKVVSPEGSGFAGIQLGHGNYSGVLIKHVDVHGYDHGLHVDSTTATMFAHAENVRLRGQRLSGVTVGAISLSLRDVQTKDVPAAVTCVDPRGFTVLVDSSLEGHGPAAIDRQHGALYVSNVETRGFADAERIEQWVVPPLTRGAGSGRTDTHRLPVRKTPLWHSRGTSTGVRVFGAAGDSSTDDSPAIQRAMDCGAAEIRFEPGRYLMNAPVVIPSHVEHVDFNFCDLVAGDDLKESNKEGFLVAGSKHDRPLFIERLLAWERWHGKHCTFTHASARTVCFKDMQTQALRFYRNTESGAKLFFDNVAVTTGPIRGGSAQCDVAFRGQKVWARQLNPERGQPMILNDGGDLVLMGYKSEGKGVVVRTVNGGRTDVLGGVINIGSRGDVAFLVEDAELRLSTASQGWHDAACHQTAVRVVRNGITMDYPTAAMPSRRFAPARGRQYTIPLFVANRWARHTAKTINLKNNKNA